MRAEASDTSEMVSQILFGEAYTILQENKKWSRVRTLHDKYEGWVDNKQINIVEKEDLPDKKVHQHFVNDLVDMVVCAQTNQILPVLLGSTLPHYHDGVLRIGTEIFSYENDPLTGKQEKSELIEVAFMYLNSPYLWGGRSAFGIDCSGFSQMVYKLIGVNIPRDAKDQADLGQVLSFVEESEAGDLAFFDNKEGIITHVGIMLDDHHIIHASGKVRVDRIDQHGIFNKDVRAHTHKLRLIKKLL